MTTETVINVATGERVEVELTEAQIAERTMRAWAMLRRTRDQLLAASDWTQVADAPVDKTAWATYRQALRDLPATTPDPLAPVWPEPPVEA